MGYSNKDENAILTVIHFHTSILDDGWVGNSKREAHLPFYADFGIDGPLIPLEDPITSPGARVVASNSAGSTGESPGVGDHRGRTATSSARFAGAACTGRAGQPLILNRKIQRSALRRIRDALEFLETHYAQPISLDDIADAVHLSRSHCCALFSDGAGHNADCISECASSSRRRVICCKSTQRCRLMKSHLTSGLAVFRSLIGYSVVSMI